MNILGINCAMHDISIALINDGKVVAAVEEERLTGKKHEAGVLVGGGMPVNGLNWILKSQGLEISQIDYFCYAGNVKHQFAGIDSLINKWVTYAKQLDPGLSKTMFIDHHLCHACSAFAGSGFKDALVVTIDGEGDSTSIALHYANCETGIETFYRLPPISSLGHFYTEVTKAIGFPFFGDEGKVMALADYGLPLHEYEDILKRFELQISLNWDGVDRLLKKAKKAHSFEEKACIAATAQKILEDGLLWIVSFGLNQVNTSNVCIGGGVAYNCKANYRISTLEKVNRVYIPFVPGDSGISIGAGIWGAFLKDEHNPFGYSLSPYLGPEYPDDQIEKLLKETKVKYQTTTDPANLGAQILADKKVLAWFQGKLEFGPRALGNRSILAPPNITGMADYVNAVVKHREKWRPFAPAIIEEDVNDMFCTQGRYPYMAMTQPLKKECYDRMSEVKSVDGSARLQTVTENDNFFFRRLLENLKASTGIPAIMNTSLNDKQQPLICSPQEAVKLFFSSGLEHLIIGSYHIQK